MEFTLQEKLDLKDQESELLKKALRETVIEREQYRTNWIMCKKISMAQARHIRVLEEELICYKRIVSN